MLRRALAIDERVYGPVHPAVASALNDLGSVALHQDHVAQAETDFRRMLSIYHHVYGSRHYLIGIAEANLASAYLQARDYSTAERIYRQAIDMFEATLPKGNMNTAIARIKLGHTLLREKRYKEAETYSLAGYDTLLKETKPGVSWLRAARTDLVAIYTALNQPDQAARFRAEIARVDAGSGTKK